MTTINNFLEEFVENEEINSLVENVDRLQLFQKRFRELVQEEEQGQAAGQRERILAVC